MAALPSHHQRSCVHTKCRTDGIQRHQCWSGLFLLVKGSQKTSHQNWALWDWYLRLLESFCGGWEELGFGIAVLTAHCGAGDQTWVTHKQSKYLHLMIPQFLIHAKESGLPVNEPFLRCYEVSDTSTCSSGWPLTSSLS